MIDNGDLRAHALCGIGRARGRDAHRIRGGNGARRKVIHLRRSCARHRLAGIRTDGANLSERRVTARNSIHAPDHAGVRRSIDLRAQRHAMIRRQRRRGGRNTHIDSRLNR